MSRYKIERDGEYLVISDAASRTCIREDKIEVFGTPETGFMVITNTERLKFVCQGPESLHRVQDMQELLRPKKQKALP